MSVDQSQGVHMVSGLTIEVAERPNAVIVRLCGDGSIHNLDVMNREFLKLSAARPALVVADLTDLTFVSSLSLGALLELRRGLQRHGGDVRVAGCRPLIADVFKRTRLDEVFAMYSTVEEAMRKEE